MWHRIQRYIRNFFGFSRGEALGFSLMAGLVLLLFALWMGYRLWPRQPYQPQADQQQLDSLISLLEAADTAGFQPRASSGALRAHPSLLFHFNPNQLPYDSLLLLGFSPALAQRLVNYRSKGGRFRTRADLLKLWGIPQELYEQLEPWMQIPEQPSRGVRQTSFSAEVKKEKKPDFATSEKFDLNQADSLQLLSVRGIGPVLSSRILKFREALGGFVAAEQVREVWGLSPETADALLERAYLPATAPLRKLSLNQATATTLARHPYISPKQAQWIVAYRDQHGPFQSAGALLQIHQLDENFVKKLAPYLEF